MANEFTSIQQNINRAIHSDANLRIALTTTLAINKARIFQRGLDSNDSQIGKYSTKPISIAKKNQARNTGKTFFKGGYKEYKSAIGHNTSYVDLRNTDQMYMDYGLIGANLSYGFGFQNKINFDKSQWLQDKYDKDIFDLDSNEMNLLQVTLVDALNRSL